MTVDPTPTPVIKGIFIKSHIKAVDKAKGKDGLKQLEKCFGKSLRYKNSEEIPVHEEIKLIICALKIISDKPIPEDQLEFEAGRFHFLNFAGTPLGKIILPVFRSNFKQLMLGSRHIAGHVFRGVKFNSENLGRKSVAVSMSNADYDIDHFKGLLHAWMEYSGLNGNVEASKIAPKTYKYILTWH